MTEDEALTLAWSGNAVVFLGSGFSKGAINESDKDFPTAEEFRIELAIASKGPLDGNLGDAAESYRIAFGDHALVDILTAKFTAKTVAEHHRIVGSIPWRRVYTTNYDNVFELCSKEAGTPATAITLKTDPFAAREDKLQCVHLNGSVEGLTIEDLDTVLKLTDTSYVTSSIASSPWALTFRNDLRLADVVIYLGYSLFDLDIKRIIFESPDLKEKSFFILGDNPSALTKQRIEKFGTLVHASVSGIATEIQKRKVSRRALSALNLESLTEITLTPPGSALRDQDVIDLFELGDVHRGLVHRSLASNGNYYLERKVAETVLDQVKSGIPAVVLTAGIGNGKSLALEGIAYRAIEKGYRVFMAKEQGEKSAVEFEWVAKLDEPALLIVDDYPSWLREIRSYGVSRKPTSRLLLSARDTNHDVLFEKLESDLGLESVPEFRIDKLNSEEIDRIVAILDIYGLWGDLAGKSGMEKKRIVASSFEAEMRGVLLRLLKSSDIGNRLRSLTGGVHGRCPYLNVVASVFILATLKAGSPRIETLYDIWGTEIISSSAFRSDYAIKNLLDFDRWTIRAKSSVVAEYFLQEILGKDVVPILITVMKALAVGARAALVGYRMSFEELMRFSTLQRILPEQGRLASAIRYYEGIKDIPQASKHPLFWFQFGISCLAEGDISRAKKYFKASYALADSTGFDTYQIDNHYARLLLVEASQIQMSAAEAMINFRKARSIINRQLQKERIVYPFRVARAYQDFIDRIGIKLNKEQLDEILRAVEFVEERLDVADKSLKRNRYVRECTHAMAYVKKRCGELRDRNTGSK